MNLAENRRHPGRSGWAWQQVRKRVLDGATVCALCGLELDFSAPPRSPKSPSVDHIVPLSWMRHLDGPTQTRLATDPANLRATHLGCNSERGNRSQAQPPQPRRSREW